MSESWIIKAIEKEAFARAMDEIRKYPQTFRFMGYSPEQINVIVCHAIREHDIDSRMTPEELAEKLK